jgi:hypothetical protein
LYSQSNSIPELQKQLVSVGKLPFKNELSVRYVSKFELEQIVDKMVDEDYPDELAQRENLFIRLMGFVQEPVDLKALKKKVVRESAGGFYNHHSKELLVLRDFGAINMISALVVVHEIRRALQDQYIGIGDSRGKVGVVDDRSLAASAALVGDSTFAMVQYSRKFSSIPLAVDLLTSYNSDALMSFSPLSNSTVLHRATGFVKHYLMMPYIEGLKYIDVLYKKKKWKAVNKALGDIPSSSEQVLHPQKYLKREHPLRVMVNYKPEGYKLYHTGVLGEYLTNILVMEDERYVDHAIGWGGDSFELHRKGDSFFLMYKSRWDQPKFASYFLFVMKRFVEKTFKVQLKAAKVGRSGFFAGKSQDGYFFLINQNNKILYVRSNDRVQINTFISGGLYD